MHRRPVLLLSSAGLFAVLAAGGPARAERSGRAIADFMVMTVCTDSADRILPGVAPVDAECTRPRQIRAGETPPYRLADFAARGKACPGGAGVVTRENVPVLAGGESRMVSFDRHALDVHCASDTAAASVLASVAGVDASFGYIMGSGGPAGLSSFDSPPLCARAPSASASRMAA